VLVALRRDLEAGLPLSEALANRREVPQVYRALVAAGEASGDLGSILGLLHEQAQVDADLDRRIKEALVYPGLALAVGVVGLLACGLVVLPRLRDLYAPLDVEMPEVTMVVLDVAALVVDHPLGAAALLVALIVAGWRAAPRLAGRLVRGTGGASRALAAFARGLAGLLERGVPLPAAVAALREVAPDGAPLDGVVARLEAGQRLADALRPEPAFPATFTWFVGAAEARGDLPAALLDLARRHEREVELRTRLVDRALGPVLLAGVGGVAALLATSVLLPMFALQRALQD
jgi:type II secretory pathway component PulF